MNWPNIADPKGRGSALVGYAEMDAPYIASRIKHIETMITQRRRGTLPPFWIIKRRRKRNPIYPMTPIIKAKSGLTVESISDMVIRIMQQTLKKTKTHCGACHGD